MVRCVRTSPTRFRRMVGVSTALVVALTACGGDGTSGPDTESPGSTSPTTGAPTSTSQDPGTATTVAPGLEQLALWPSASEIFTSPRAAAEDFVMQVLGVPPELGEFMAGDTRSGEIQVFSPGDPPTLRSLLLLRRLGPSDGWFVIGTINDNAFISSPVSGQSVSAGELTVRGQGEGFEATVVIEAFVAGRPEPVLDRQVTFAGNLGVPAPFEVTLDLSDAEPGDTVLIVVRGGVGLETDPGQFGAIAVLIVE